MDGHRSDDRRFLHLHGDGAGWPGQHQRPVGGRSGQGRGRRRAALSEFRAGPVGHDALRDHQQQHFDDRRDGHGPQRGSVLLPLQLQQRPRQRVAEQPHLCHPVLANGSYSFQYMLRDQSAQTNQSGYSTNYTATIKPTTGYHPYTLGQLVRSWTMTWCSFPARSCGSTPPTTW